MAEPTILTSSKVRAFAESAYNTLMKAGASKTGPPPSTRDVAEDSSTAKTTMISMLPAGLQAATETMSLTFGVSLELQAALVAELVFGRQFSDRASWGRAIGSFMHPWLSDDDEAGARYTETVRQHFEAIDRAKFAPEQNGLEDEGEVLCDTLFSLAYGTLLLLSHTTLRLIRGRRYGILGANGSGKSTLMRQLRDGKVENFPPQSELRCVMVEHALQGEDTSMSIVDFIASGQSFTYGYRALLILLFRVQTRH